MNRVFYFLKSTKWISRILFCLWVFFSIFAKFQDETRLQIVFEFGGLLLIPAILIEAFKNPALKNTECKNPENKDVTTGEKLRSFFWPFRWVYIVMLSLWIYGSFFSPFSKSDGILFAIIIYGILFFFPIIVIEICVQLKKKAPVKKTYKVKSYKYISPRRISGLVILGLAVIFILVGVTMNSTPSTYNLNNMYPGYTFGGIGLFLLLLSANDPKTKAEYDKRKKRNLLCKRTWRKQNGYEKRMDAYRGILLTEQQIRQLEAKSELPIVDTPVCLGRGEIAVYYSVATRQEMKNRVIGRKGGYSGGTVRIAKGFSIHTGGFSRRVAYGNVYTYYKGELVLTNKRLVFLSNQKGFEVSYNAITAVTTYTDRLLIQSRSHTYTLLLPKADLAKIAFDVVRTGKLPIAKTSDYKSDEYEYIEYDEFVTDKISSIDGMDGCEFEYFCADLLRKNKFTEVSVTKVSGDQGVDILATKDGIKYAIQCKNYASALGNTPVQEVNAGKIFYNCHVGVVITNSTFTPGAKTLAQATGVLLWDRVVLQKMMDDAKK